MSEKNSWKFYFSFITKNPHTNTYFSKPQREKKKWHNWKLFFLGLETFFTEGENEAKNSIDVIWLHIITTPSGTENIHFLVEVLAFSHGFFFFGHSISDGDEQRTLTLKIYTNSQWTKMGLGFVTYRERKMIVNI